ncbi:MAG: hypothetical protein WBN83_04180, partial [Desulfoprunum sp.]|uniref:hypothetical protein n=1 Tax=Desulfoprunum sp. TaxID=2020866 RepID=UPI003C765EBA
MSPITQNDGHFFRHVDGLWLIEPTTGALPVTGGVKMQFTDRLRRAKHRNLEIMNAKKAEDREKPYKDLIEVTEKTIGYGEKGL